MPAKIAPVARWIGAILPGQRGTLSNGKGRDRREVEIIRADANPGLFFVKFGGGKPELHFGVPSFANDVVTYLDGGRI